MNLPLKIPKQCSRLLAEVFRSMVDSFQRSLQYDSRLLLLFLEHLRLVIAASLNYVCPVTFEQMKMVA